MKQVQDSNEVTARVADGLELTLDVDQLTEDELNAVGGGAFPFIQN
jgi:hypothetical protein